MDRALHGVKLLEATIWEDPWLQLAVPAIVTAHYKHLTTLPREDSIDDPNVITEELLAFIQSLRDELKRSLRTLDDPMPEQRKNTHIRCDDGRVISWDSLRELKNNATATQVKIGCRLWILAAVRGVRNQTIRHNDHDMVISKPLDALSTNAVGIADDKFFDEEYLYLGAAYDTQLNSIPSLRHGWDDDHLKTIRMLQEEDNRRVTTEKSLSNAMKSAKQALCKEQKRSSPNGSKSPTAGGEDLKKNLLYVEMSDEKEGLDKMLDILVETKMKPMCRMSNPGKGRSWTANQTWTNYIEQNVQGNPGDKIYILAEVLADVASKAPLFRRCKALVIMMNQLLELIKYEERKKRLELIAERRLLKKSAAASSSDKPGLQAHQHQHEHQLKMTAAFSRASDETVRSWIIKNHTNELTDLVKDFGENASPGFFVDDSDAQLAIGESDFEYANKERALTTRVWNALSTTQRARISTLYNELHKADEAHEAEPKPAVRTVAAAALVPATSSRKPSKKKKPALKKASDRLSPSASDEEEFDKTQTGSPEQNVLRLVRSDNLEGLRHFVESSAFDRTLVRSVLERDTGFLELACMRGNLEMIDLLITHGSNAATALLVTAGPESSMEVFEFVFKRLNGSALKQGVNQRGGRRFVPANQTQMHERPVTPLIAALNDWEHGGEKVRMLLNGQADPNARGTNLTPLMLCAASGNHELVSELIENKASVDATDRTGWTALLLATNLECERDQWRAWRGKRPFPGHKAYATCVHVLLAERADPMHQNDEKMNALMVATRQGSAACVASILRMHGATEYVNLQHESSGVTAIFWTLNKLQKNALPRTRPDDLGCLKLLLAHGASARIVRNDKSTILMCACALGEHRAVEMLLTESDATETLDWLDGSQRCALRCACKYDAPKILVEAHPALEHMPKTGRLFALVGVHQKFERCVQLLLRGKAAVDGLLTFTPLMEASRRGNAGCVRILIKHRANHHVMHEGETVLMRAARQNHHSTMHVLLKGLREAEAQRSGVADYVNLQSKYRIVSEYSPWIANPDATSSGSEPDLETEQTTALLLACEELHEKCIHILLEFGADVHAQSTFRNTPLLALMASKNASVKRDPISEPGAASKTERCLLTLLEHGAAYDGQNFMLNHQNDYKQTALMFAAEQGRLDCVAFCIEKYRELDLNAEDQGESTALLYACKGSLVPMKSEVCIEIVSALLSAGADPSLRSPLLHIVHKDAVEVARLLIEARANVNDVVVNDAIVGFSHYNALMIAAKNNARRCFELLLDNGANVNQRASSGMTALLISCETCLSPQFVKMLIERGADVNVVYDQDLDANALLFCLRCLATNPMIKDTPTLPLHDLHVLSLPNDETERWGHRLLSATDAAGAKLLEGYDLQDQPLTVPEYQALSTDIQKVLENAYVKVHSANVELCVDYLLASADIELDYNFKDYTVLNYAVTLLFLIPKFHTCVQRIVMKLCKKGARMSRPHRGNIPRGTDKRVQLLSIFDKNTGHYSLEFLIGDKVVIDWQVLLTAFEDAHGKNIARDDPNYTELEVLQENLSQNTNIGTVVKDVEDKHMDDHIQVRLKSGDLVIIHASALKHIDNGYDGEYVKGIRHGWGVMVYADGSKYEGEWSHDQRHGIGKETAGSDDKVVRKYEGRWDRDMKKGPFKVTFNNGATGFVVYDGNRKITESIIVDLPPAPGKPRKIQRVEGERKLDLPPRQAKKQLRLMGFDPVVWKDLIQ